jgi:hypothetical protein
MLAPRCWLSAGIVFGLTECAGAFDSAQGTASLAMAAREELIAEKDVGAPADDEEDIASLDNRKVAWRSPSGKKWTVMLNGDRQAAEFDEVRHLTFSRDSQHLAFAARRDKTWLMVLDAREPAQRFDEVGSPVFSQDGARIAYAAKRDKKWTIVIGTETSATSYDDVGLPVFSQDGMHVTYSAKRAGKWTVVADGEERGPQFDGVSNRIFSPDGRRVAYVGRRGGTWIGVLDGKEGPPFDILGGLAFSYDSRRFAYAGADVHRSLGSQKAQGRAIVDGESGPQFEGNQVGSLTKSMVTGTNVAIVEGYFSQLFSDVHGVTAPVFSPDGTRVAYAVHRGKDDAAVIVDGAPGPRFPSIVAGPVFSADSRHVAYVVSDGDVKMLVIDGERVGRESAVGTDFVSELTFAANNRTVGYIGITGGSWYERGLTLRARRRVYVDGQSGAEYDALRISSPQFTSDGRHTVYAVYHVQENSRNVSFVVTDGAEGKRYDYLFAALDILDNRAVVYAAQSGRKFFRVTQSLQ